jgi:hypothetical protein
VPDETTTSPTTPAAAPPGASPFRFLARALAFAGLLLILVFAGSPLLRASPAVADVSLGSDAALELDLLDDAHDFVLYQGDSVVSWGMEAPETTLPALLADATGLPLVNVSHSAYGPRLFLAQLRYLEREGIAPRGHLIGLSLASLGPFRERNPGWRFDARARALTTGWLLPVRAASVLKHRFGAPTDAEFRATPVRGSGGEVVGTLGQLVPREGEPALARDDRIRLALLAAYSAPLAASEQLPDLRALFTAIARSGRTHLVYLTPMDHELAARHLTLDERAVIDDDRRALADLAAELGVRYVDLSQALGSDAFDAEHDVPTEHLDAGGRRRLAALLGRELGASR